MSFDALIKELIESNRELAAALKGSAGTSAKTTSTTKDADTTEENDGGESKIAGKKTYVWFKNLNHGVIIERGEAIPTNDGAVGLQKGTWDTQCKKHGLDPETGKKPVAADDLNDLDDLDDLGNDIGADDDMGGLDDLDDLEEEVTIDRETVKAKLIELMRAKGKTGKDTVDKLLKKYKATSMPTLKEENFQAIYDDAVKLLAK